MSNTRLFKKTIIATVIALSSQQALAAGFQLNSQSATGLGRAFAGDAVIADNASSMARNAATMALFDDTSMSLGVVMIKSMIEVKDADYTYTANGATYTTESSNYDDAGTESFPPNFHLIVPMNDKWAWGVNAYSNFGTRTEFGNAFTGSEYGGETEIMSVNFGGSLSYRIDDQWSVGAGIDLIYGQGTLKRTFNQNVVSVGGASLLDIDGADGWGVGFNIGGVYELDANNRFGLSYRYSPEIEAEDDKGQEIKLPLPDMIEFSGYHRIEDTKFAVHYSYQWIGWSAFDKIKFSNVNGPTGAPITESDYNWKDAYHISLGGTYYLNEKWTLRAGYMYDESAQDATTSISVPDSDRSWFSGGFTYHLTPKSNVDFGFTYLLGKDVDVYQETPSAALGGNNLSSIQGKTHADAILVGLQYSRTF